MAYNQHNHHPSNSIDNAAYPADSAYTPGGPSASINNAAYPADSSYSPAGHHPSGSISSAAYPQDSAYTPGGPAASISNAAYPQDSSYRPSAPTTRSDDKLAMPEARYSQSYNNGPSARQAPAAAPYPTYPASTQPAFQHVSPPGAAWSQAQANDPLYSPTSKPISPWTPDGMSAAHPNLPPPPPYDPSRPGTGTSLSTPHEPVSPNPSEHAPLNQQPQHSRQQSLQQQQNVARPASNYSNIPQQTPAPAAAHVASPHSPGAQDASPSAQERGLAGEQPRAYLQSMTGGMPAYGNTPGVLGPVAKERKRRKQKLGILAVVLCAVLLFLIALIVGILVGVVKINAKDDKPPPPPPRF